MTDKEVIEQTLHDGKSVKEIVVKMLISSRGFGKHLEVLSLIIDYEIPFLEKHLHELNERNEQAMRVARAFEQIPTPEFFKYGKVTQYHFVPAVITKKGHKHHERRKETH